MYIHGWYFFVTYHTCGVIFVRIIRTSLLSLLKVSKNSIVYYLIISLAFFFAAWIFSVGEIYATTMEAIREQFNYRNMDWALSYGALAYSCYFIVSFPMVYFLDENVKIIKIKVKDDNDIKQSNKNSNNKDNNNNNSNNNTDDDNNNEKPWTIWKTIENGFAAGMISFILLDIVCQFVIVGWQKEYFSKC